MGESEVERLFEQVDANADDMVTCDEFLSFVVDRNSTFTHVQVPTALLI